MNNLGLSSDRVITVNQKTNNGQELVTVDLTTKNITRKNNSAEAVLPHPSLNYNAVRAKTPGNSSTNTVLIYNMDKKEKILNS